MGFKKRGYNKEEQQSKTRDYSLFAIACEGTEREPEYFRPFDRVNRIKVDIIENPGGQIASAPKNVLERAKRYVEEVGLSQEDGDSLWLVVDIDRWPRKQLEELANYCNDFPNWNLIISNPCFEIWLLFHKLSDLSNLHCSSAAHTKQELHKLQRGGYSYKKYLPLFKEAIQNARVNDTNADHHYPNHKETKVYLLAEALLDRIGHPGFDDFVKEYLSKSNDKRGKKK